MNTISEAIVGSQPGEKSLDEATSIEDVIQRGKAEDSSTPVRQSVPNPKPGVVQVQKEWGKETAVSQVGIGRSKNTEPFKLTVEVRDNAWTPGSVKLTK